MIGPPYFQLDERSLLEHFQAAAAACAPLPFYVYEFERASGYAVPISGPARAARARAEPRRAQGLGRAVRQVRALPRRGARRLRRAGGAHLRRHRRGAVGAVSGLAAAFPDRVAAVVREPTEAGAIELGELRAAVERFPRHAALKFILGLRGVPSPGGRPAAAAAAERRRARGAARVARIVVAGAGAIGASIAYHLALRGADDVVLADVGEIAGGATGKAMGGVRQQFTTEAEVRLAQASVRLFQELGAPLFEQVGYLFLATTEPGPRRARGAPRRSRRRSASRSSASTPASRGAPRGRRARRDDLPRGRDRRSRPA